MEDATLDWVSANRNELYSYVDFLLPPERSLAIAQSKAATNEFAASLGLPVPETIQVTDSRALTLQMQQLRDAGTLHNYIAKPVSGSGSAGIVYLDRADLPDWNLHWSTFGPVVIQRRIAANGQGLGVSVLFDRQGECVAAFAHARLQEYPNTGGPSTARISIADDALIEKSIRLLKALNWCGVAMVEWKLDPADNIPKLLEINPRFWGSLELAVRSGVNFPLLYAQAAIGTSVECCLSYQLGVVCRWMVPGEILRYLTQPSENREGLFEFLHGLPTTAEEWDKTDLRGSVSAAVCPAIAVLNPKYWKYLTR
jgi:predicted ATP-grasp superfamily ATP-dependent carboligase